MTTNNVIGKIETQRVRPEDITAGVTFYCVRVTPAGGHLEIVKRTLIGNTFFCASGYPSVKYRIGLANEGVLDLRAAGIVPSKRTFNAAFFCPKEAAAYGKRMLAHDFTPFEKRRFAKLLERQSFTVTNR